MINNDIPHGMESEENSGRVKGHLIETPCGYFESEGAKETLIHHAGKWIDTPFVAHAHAIGAGVDCVNLVAQIYIACGFLKDFNPPAYTMDGGKHNPNSQLVRWLENTGKFSKVETPQPGDTLCFLWRGMSEHHAGVMLYRDQFLHVLEKRRVQIASIKDRTYSNTLKAIYRPMRMN